MWDYIFLLIITYHHVLKGDNHNFSVFCSTFFQTKIRKNVQRWLASSLKCTHPKNYDNKTTQLFKKIVIIQQYFLFCINGSECRFNLITSYAFGKNQLINVLTSNQLQALNQIETVDISIHNKHNL